MVAGIRISISHDLDRLKRQLTDFQKKQLPFAAARALTAVAKQVQSAERDELKADLENPTPFTMNSVGVKAARKDNPQAEIYMRDIAAAYLHPFEFGGVHKLNSKALLNPKTIPLNQFGNIPRGMLKRLKGSPDTFIGTITFRKSGQTVSGVWLRPAAGKRRTGGRGTKGNTWNHIGGVRTGLTLLIRFGDALPVHQSIKWRATAERVIKKNLHAELSRALADAMRTARR